MEIGRREGGMHSQEITISRAAAANLTLKMEEKFNCCFPARELQSGRQKFLKFNFVAFFSKSGGWWARARPYLMMKRRG